MDNDKELDQLTAGFLTAAAWLGADKDGNPADLRGHAFNRKSEARARAICAEFRTAAGDAFTDAVLHINTHQDTGSTPAGAIGARLYLTRSGAGVSFQDDRELDKTTQEALCKAAGYHESYAQLYRGKIDLYA